MRNMIGIFVNFAVQTGHRHPLLQTVHYNYSILLLKCGQTKGDIENKIANIIKPI